MAAPDNTRAVNPRVIEKVYNVFFSPPRHEASPANQEVVACGVQQRLPYDAGELSVTRWGQDGPAVLLMHGWGGAQAQMAGFVQTLLEAGYRAVAYDQPAHGESSGRQTNILEITPTVALVTKHAGPFQAILAHSFGTLVTSNALAGQKALHPEKLVYFGALNRLMDTLPRFQRLGNLPDPVIAGLREMIDRNFDGNRLEAINNADLVQRLPIPALMFHDRADEVTPFEDSRQIADAWPAARLVELDGLGHKGALHDAGVHEQVIRFLKT